MAAPDYSNFTQEQIDAERAAMAAERAAMDAAKAARTGLQPEIVVPLPEVASAEETEEVAEEDSPAQPWPHATLSYCGEELEVRIPEQGALVAISMLELLDGNGAAQVDIFNTFLKNHLSPASMVIFLKEMTDPDSKMTIQDLVQALVRLRTELNPAL